ncbi:MAG: hypothetical protein ACREQB_07045, partial [Candidatus Binataceae bacterium]
TASVLSKDVYLTRRPLIADDTRILAAEANCDVNGGDRNVAVEVVAWRVWYVPRPGENSLRR